MRGHALIAAGAAAVAFAGCGGDEPKGPTKAQYIAQVDRICKRAKPKERELKTELQQAGQTRSQQTALRRLEQALDDGVRDLRAVLAEIRKVRRPAGPAATGAEDYVRAVQADIDILAQMRSALEKRDPRGFQRALRQANTRGDETQNVAQRYGFKVCGTD